MYDSAQFLLISDKVPSNWTVNQIESGTITFAPAIWQPFEFWDDYYDYVPEAQEIYKREARIIYDEENK